MAERTTLRGSRLGGTSFEDEAGVDFAPRRNITYDCPQGHRFEIPMADDADVPFRWECPRCGSPSQQVNGIEPPVADHKPVRTHWDMLLERRSITELEDILSERLELLRSGEIGPAHLHRRSGRRRASA